MTLHPSGTDIMPDPDTILHERLEKMREDFLTTLHKQLDDLSIKWNLVTEHGCDSSYAKELRELSHDLSGKSYTFGLITLANAANKLEQFVLSLSTQTGKPSGEHNEHFSLLLKSLESVIQKKEANLQQYKSERWELSRYSAYSNNDNRLVYIVEHDLTQGEQLAVSLSQHGYQTRIFDELVEFKKVLTEVIPEAIIIDLIFPGDELAGAKCLLDIRNKTQVDVPIMFISKRNDIEARLQAVRAGSASYFTKPLDMNKIIDALNELTTGIPKDPYRIMVVDDDEALTEFYKLILEQHGMQVITVNNPLQTLDTIHETHPELILMDVYMPECSGFELTSLIRQQEQFAGISIIFLSSENDFERQLSALDKGGDDFLTKPVDPDLLISTISTRVSRARTLSNMTYNLLSALREVENRNFALDQHSIITITNISGEIIYVNDKFCELTGFSEEEIIGQRHSLLDSGIHPATYFDDLWDTIRSGEVWQNEMCEMKKNGDVFWADTTIVPFTDEQKRPYQYVAIQNDITSRIQAERNLAEARDVAINANQAKSDFLSKMSHELRTPLNAILGFSQLLQSDQGQGSSDPKIQYSQEIHNAGTHLLNLINDILDLSRIEVGQLKVDLITVPLAPFLDQCSSLVSPIAREKGISLNKSYNHRDDLMVNADPIRLKQVLVNLLSNAIKYNKHNGSIEITYKRGSDKNILIEVIDTGTGMPEEEQSMLFQPFTRLSMHKKEEGVGIGLALSKRLIELMNGKIGFESELKQGTRFWIELREDKLETEEIVQETITPSLPRKNFVRPYTLLYVEDNQRNLSLVREILAQRPNIKLIHADTAERGIELARLHHPNIVLMDIQLPGMSGLDSLKILKQNKEYDDIPVIAISAYASNQDIERAYKVGFDEYITKPINVENFLNTIDNFVKQQYLH